MSDNIKGFMFFIVLITAFLSFIFALAYCDKQIELTRESTLKEMGYSPKMINNQCYLYRNNVWVRCSDVIFNLSAYPVK